MMIRNFAKLKAEVDKHVAADAVVQSIYWDSENQRGCFIGCLAHSSDPFFIAREYCIPASLSRLAESIFESLPADEAPKFFAAFPDAVGGDGKDLHGVPFLFLAEQLRQVPTDGAMFPVAVQSALGRWADGLELMARNQRWRDYYEARAELAWVRNRESSSYGDLCGSLCAEGDSFYFGDLFVDMQRFFMPGLMYSRSKEEALATQQRDLLLRLVREAPYAVS
jgi:hypothetical protein